MRIAMVSEHASPLAMLGGVDGGGQNVHVDALARALAARGHEVVVHTRRDDPNLPRRVRLAPGVTVDHVDAGDPVPMAKDELLPLMPQFGADLARQWQKWHPDIVHAHFWRSGVAATPAAAAVGVPLTITFHALGAVKKRHQAAADTSPPARIDAERELIGTVARVIATAREEERELRAQGAPPGRVDVVPCGVDTDWFRPDGPQWARGSQGLRLLSLGRLVPRKGVDDAIAMLPQLADAELVIAGGAPSGMLDEDPEALRLSALSEELGVADRVAFIGAVARDQVPALIRSADAVVCLPWYEPFGIVPLEAMACGRPVIGSAVGGLLDTIVHGRNGLLVDPHSPEAAAAAARMLADSPQLRRSMGVFGRRRVLQTYGWPRVAAATEAVYDSVLREASQKSSPAPAGAHRSAFPAAGATR